MSNIKREAEWVSLGGFNYNLLDADDYWAFLQLGRHFEDLEPYVTAMLDRFDSRRNRNANLQTQSRNRSGGEVTSISPN